VSNNATNGGGDSDRDSPTPKRAAVIYRADRVDLLRLHSLVDETLEHLDWRETIWLPTEAEKPGSSQVVDALRAGATTIVIVGGDGTVRHVLQGLFEGPVDPDTVAIGIVPVGTGNVLSRNLGIQLNNQPRAIRRALLGDEWRIDLGVATLKEVGAKQPRKQVFSVMAGVGLDAKILPTPIEC